MRCARRGTLPGWDSIPPARGPCTPQTLNEARGLLVEVGGREHHVELTAAGSMRQSGIELGFFESRLFAPTAVVRPMAEQSDIGGLPSARSCKSPPQVFVGATLRRNAKTGQLGRRGHQDVDCSVNSV